MKKSKFAKGKLIYLLGAGRSGTTVMATVLGAHPEILTVGEMHQFLDHMVENKDCSCGQNITNCRFWNTVLGELTAISDNGNTIQTFSNSKERHRNIPLLLMSKKKDKKYLNVHDKILNEIFKVTSKDYLLDSSKYIARYLLLRKSDEFEVKGIYVVRDVRGVINSFKKNVQTSRGPISTIIYYCLVNMFGQLICWIDKDVVKIKYEDFVESPDITLAKIYDHLQIVKKNFVKDENVFKVPHIIGGNRLKHQNEIVILKDEKWKKNIPRNKQLFYYFLTLPFMILNNYKL